MGSIVEAPGRAGEDPNHTAVDDADLALLRLLAEGNRYPAIADKLEISVRQVGRHLRAICDELGVKKPIEATVWAVRNGWL